MLKLDLRYFKILLCLLFMLCSVMAKENIEKDKKCCKTKPGYVNIKTGESKDIQTMEISVDGRAENMEMKKKKLPLLSKPPSEKNKDVSMYVSSDGSMACMKECKRKSTECKAQCLQKNNKGYTYVSEDNAMDIEPNDKLIMDFADINRSYRDRIDALKRQANRNQRERRETEMPNLVVPNLNNDTATLKIKLVIDDSVMDIFQDFVGGNATKAQYEAENFFTLAMNTVAMYFPSVSEWGFSFKTFDDVTKPVDLAVWLHSIDFPSMENNEFDSIDPIKNSNENETLISRLYFDENGNYLGDTGLWVEFALYMRQECNGSTSFNHLQVITG
ncbi:uncharacterized protein LOC123542723 [Mercenaria mercenaria]|uniref:uncharacterized protein LOC123542723 n=1 Tax=Mercenaria mercenaria TaxID=6596 RepID=UPI00234EC149|nr:uncharacterized protein LOC123542723 [Mercenaria mercenaria]